MCKTNCKAFNCIARKLHCTAHFFYENFKRTANMFKHTVHFQKIYLSQIKKNLVKKKTINNDDNLKIRSLKLLIFIYNLLDNFYTIFF